LFEKPRQFLAHSRNGVSLVDRFGYDEGFGDVAGKSFTGRMDLSVSRLVNSEAPSLKVQSQEGLLLDYKSENRIYYNDHDVARVLSQRTLQIREYLFQHFREERIEEIENQVPIRKDILQGVKIY